MEMRYFWIADQVARQQFSVHWHPGLENMGDYYTKHHPGLPPPTSPPLLPLRDHTQPMENFHEHLHRKSCEGVLKSHSLPQTDPDISLSALPPSDSCWDWAT
eukprot:CCRYP_009648-RA/>CCRYP_009648-RA protein AED:0.38 eAED:0.38 QI:0/-1/0/1/-1/0/1/0/101